MLHWIHYALRHIAARREANVGAVEGHECVGGRAVRRELHVRHPARVVVRSEVVTHLKVDVQRVPGVEGRNPYARGHTAPHHVCLCGEPQPEAESAWSRPEA